MALRELGGNFDYGDVCLWPVADLGQRPTCVRDTANSGRVTQAPKPTLMTHIRHSTWLRSGPSSRALLVCAQRSWKSERPKFVTAVTA
jgi:hypothetical protein